MLCASFLICTHTNRLISAKHILDDSSSDFDTVYHSLMEGIARMGLKDTDSIGSTIFLIDFSFYYLYCF